MNVWMDGWMDGDGDDDDDDNDDDDDDDDDNNDNSSNGNFSQQIFQTKHFCHSIQHIFQKCFAIIVTMLGTML